MAPSDFPAGGYVSDYLAFWAILFAIVASIWGFFRLTRGRTGALRLVTGNVLILIALVWTLVVAGETYYRYVYDETDSYGLMLTNHSWMRRHVELNSSGFRDDEFTASKAPGVTRVACVGDSFTQGWGVKRAEDTFPGILKTKLAQAAPGKFEVRNYGQPGWTTGHEADWIDGLAAGAGIDRIILGYCLNDPDDLLPPDKWFHRSRAPRVPWIEPTRSFLLDQVWFHTKLASDPQVKGYFLWMREAYDDPSVFGKQTERFRHIAKTCREAEIRLDVVVFPLFNEWGDAYKFDSCHERVTEAWSMLGVPTLDLREAYRGVPGAELVASRYDAHPNAKAHAIAAKAILDRLFGVR